MEKITKREMYKAMINYANGAGFEFETEDGVVEVSADEIIAFAENEIALLDKKSAKARETAKKKKAENDELMDLVRDALTDEFEPISEIAARVAEVDAEATVSKVTYRLTKLAEAGVCEKTDLKLKTAEGKSRTVKGYARVTAEAPVEE